MASRRPEALAAMDNVERKGRHRHPSRVRGSEMGPADGCVERWRSTSVSGYSAGLGLKDCASRQEQIVCPHVEYRGS